ncbi:hypothetical protein JCM15457_1918 [Liquorilactobacillus sucicola DSM 21376 = JCM 15457]|nr:ABC transporter permease subunit [Liquorilactobacillus sucicola]GAJ26964.1 hypothetical protein JCM15457_1918 [Liquorilactobacillus sucicola DSM 21376 = JCM 15457]
MSLFWTDLGQIVPNALQTLYIAAWSIIVGILGGGVVSYIRIKKIPVLSLVVQIYLSFARSVPMIVVLYVCYYALPNLTAGLVAEQGIRVPKSIIAVFALSLFSSAYFGESFRSAYFSVGKLQMEAALASNLSKWSALKRIILPQAAFFALPNVFNTVMDIIKGTAIIYNIGLLEITGKSILVGSMTYQYIPAYFAAWVIYIAIYIIVNIGFKFIINKLNFKGEEVRL